MSERKRAPIEDEEGEDRKPAATEKLSYSDLVCDSDNGEEVREQAHEEENGILGSWFMAYKYEVPRRLDFGEGNDKYARFADVRVKIEAINGLYRQDRDFVEQLLQDDILVEFLQVLQDGKKWELSEENLSQRLTLTRAFANRVKYLKLLAELLKDLCEADCFKVGGDKATYLRNAHKDARRVGKTIPRDAHFTDTLKEWGKAVSILEPLDTESEKNWFDPASIAPGSLRESASVIVLDGKPLPKDLQDPSQPHFVPTSAKKGPRK